jgi:hypothetical protein
MIVEKIAEELELALITNVPKSDRARVDLVKAYRFQDSPEDYKIYVSVVPGNPDEPTQVHGRIDIGEDLEKLGLYLPAGEVGGGHLWWRRGRIKIGAFLLDQGYTESVAGDIAHTVLGRTEYHTERVNVTSLIDDYGERAHGNVYVCASNFFEGGGPDDQYIWRGDVRWQVLTQRPY